jgi:hypothetical protein
MQMASYDELISRYEQGIAAFESALDGIPNALLDTAPAPGKWTIRQIAAHLADAELVACSRFRWIAAEPGSPLKSFDQDQWALSLGYAQQSPTNALELFRALRRATAAMLRGLPEGAWQQTGHHEERGPVSLEQMVTLYAGHAEHHAKQIEQMRESLAPVA